MRWLATVIGNTCRNASVHLICPRVLPASTALLIPHLVRPIGSLRKLGRVSAAGVARREPGPVATSLGLVHPALPVDRRRRTRLALLLASWCQRQRCPLRSLAGERREFAALPKRQGVGDRRPSKEVSVLAEPFLDEGVQ